MTKKLFLLALCLVMLAPMLFGEAKNDASIDDAAINANTPTKNYSPKLLYTQTPQYLDTDSRDLLWDQQSTIQGTAAACQADTGMGFLPRCGDNFAIPYDADIDSLVWWGYYWGTPTNIITAWNIEFYVDSGGGLGPQQAATYWAGITTWNEVDLGGWFRYEASIPPFSALTGVTYYLVPQPVMIFPPQWGVNADVPPNVGDGNEMYFKSAYFGFPQWVTATTVFGTPYEYGFQIYGAAPAADTFTWDFEDGWQGWTHANGVPFPGGWGVVDSGYTCGSYIVGVAGDSCMSIADEVIVPNDTAFSPVFDEFADTYLHWGMNYQNFAGYDTIIVIARAHDGSSWGGWQFLAGYGSDMGLFWDSADVSGITGDSLQVAWVWDDFTHSCWFCSFDEVGPVILFPPEGHDVGSVSFLSPGTMVAPGNIDVIGEVGNYGGFEETYDVHCVVQDPTFAIVLDTTINVTTGVGERDTINFGQVSFQHGFTYDLMMATLLVDDNPGNDTLTQQTVCSAAYWEILPNMPYTTSGPYVGYHVDSLGYTFVHIFGGNPGPQNNHYIYDYANGTYATGTVLPTASTYGGSCSFNNMIYLCGAWTGATDVITIYDCINDTYTTASLPAGGTANPTVVSKDNRYVYVIGGARPPGAWTGGTGVDVYDAIADTFFSSPTQLPANCAVMSGAGALIAGDTIIVAGGYDGGGSMTDRVFYGVIDPMDPGNITWTVSGTPYPGGQCYRGAGSDWDGIGYFTGGSNNTWNFTETYSYEAGIGWVTLPSKPTGCMNLGWVMAPVDTQYTDDAEILGFAMGGYSPYMDIGEAYHTATIVTSIVEKPNEGVGQFSCKLISSNPISSRNAHIQLVMPAEGPVKFSIYDVTGRRILTREFPRIHAGTHTIRWERKNDQGTSVSAGNYFYRVEAAGNVTTGKLVIVN